MVCAIITFLFLLRRKRCKQVYLYVHAVIHVACTCVIGETYAATVYVLRDMGDFKVCRGSQSELNNVIQKLLST